MITAPDDLTAAAIKRLRNDPDFSRVVDWLARATATQDKANRTLVDGVQLRMGQGIALALDDLVQLFEGKERQGVLSDTRVASRRAQSDTGAGGAS